MAAPRPRRTPQKVQDLASKLAMRGLFGVLDSLCREYNVTIGAVLSGARTKRVVQARDACIYKVLQVPMSTPEAGELFDMDHTGIIAARDRYIRRDKGRLLT
jgi:chromosomal replication initiation ATPase DnaA